ncbi:hypothetical protein [Terrabacter sp. Soil811]|uniref:hypothetical protein n=1 Tax=Terrabacter sp. Soil811 TaxID=1736419 RepID=UPI0012E37C34|nr:hypothetical protein [Terrabacter sp. Soil811]
MRHFNLLSTLMGPKVHLQQRRHVASGQLDSDHFPQSRRPAIHLHDRQDSSGCRQTCGLKERGLID